jgi:membrane associated rhomboid family serine protease
MFFFPYGTDAPIYYWPYTTVAMIVVNVLVFVLEMTNPGLMEWLALQTGNGLHPLEWLTSNFDHEGVGHIAGNMVFLWAFGLVVEGKLGWWRTLAIYLGLGVVQSCLEQVLLLFGPVHHILGASAIISGFMAMSFVWAPENSLQCMFVFMFNFYFHSKQVDVPIKVFVVIFLGLQALDIAFSGAILSSAMLHAFGAALGFAVGIWMVKSKRVDCENWDIFSVARGRHRMTQKERDAEVLNSAEYRQRKAERTNKRAAETQQWIREQIAEDNPKVAAEAYRHVKMELPDWSLPDADLFGLIIALRKAGLLADAIPLMAEHLSRYTTNVVALRMALGDALIRERRPAQAIKVLKKLSDTGLDARQQQLVAGLREKARKLHAEDPYEVADEDW